jgi:hypothetical protein
MSYLFCLLLSTIAYIIVSLGGGSNLEIAIFLSLWTFNLYHVMENISND